MKKIVFAVLALYFAAAGVLLLLDEPAAETVRILSIESESSFLITDAADRLSFTLCLDDPDAFVADLGAIASAALDDGETILALTPAEIAATGHSFVRDGVTYDEYRYSFTTDGISSDGVRLAFRDASLVLRFADGSTGAYAVGDADIVFGAPGEPRHLDFTRLYAVFNVEAGREAIAGIVIGLEAKTGTGVTVTDIDVGCPGIAASVGEVVVLADAPPADQPIGSFYGGTTRSLLAAAEPGEIVLLDGGLYFIPVVHDGRIRSATRFMILISYEYEGGRATFAIDDFSFRTPFPFSEEYGGEIHGYEHRR